MIKNILIVFFIPLILFSCYYEKKHPIIPQKGMPDAVMHKGLHLNGKLAPENSLDAIAMAGRVGAHFVEIDVNITKDGEIVLLHDPVINNDFNHISGYMPIEGGDIFINTLTLGELRTNYVFKAEDPAMRRPIPTLKEALTLCKIQGIYPLIEIKEDFFTQKDVRKTYDIAITVMGKGNFAITSFNAWIIEYLRHLDNELSLYRDMVEDTDYLKKYKVNYYSHYEPSWYNQPPQYEKNIETMHRAGLLAFTWTVPKEAYDTIVVKGYDGILSDDIAPNFKPEYAIVNEFSNNDFRGYHNEGTIVDNITCLQKGQALEWKGTVADSLYLGGIYFTIEAKGILAIEATDFKVVRENKSDDYKLYRFQYLFHKEKPFFKITAQSDTVLIKSVWLGICDF